MTKDEQPPIIRKMISMRESVHRAFWVVLSLAILLYGLQTFTPLRLDTDGIMYLSLADSAAAKGFMRAMLPPYPFPKGYAVFVFVLMKTGVFSSATMVLSNLVLLFVALILSFRTLINLGFDRTHALIACLMTLLSFAAVKHSTQGRSDFLFFALTACAGWLMALAGNVKWLAILPCVVCAIEVRFSGLALLVPTIVLVWPIVRHRKFTLAMVLCGVILAVCAGGIAGHRYLESNLQILRAEGLLRLMGRALILHSQDMAELSGNVPFSKLPTSAHVPALVFGGMVLLLLLAGVVPLWRHSKWLSCYLIAYSCLILPWPFTDPRFWLPIMPFLVISMYLGLVSIFKNPPRILVAAYVVVFCGLGLAALGYSTRLTFSGQAFAERYGDGRLTAIYLSRCSASASDADRLSAAHLLRRYEWHCQPQP